MLEGPAPHTTASCCTPERITPPVIEVRNLTVTAATRTILRDVSFDILPRQVFGIIGPSGAGKSTLLKCLNRLIDLAPGLRVSGDVVFHGRSVFDRSTDPDDLRARIGMLFQQPVVFPHSIYQNVIFGVRRLGVVRQRDLPRVSERALREAALWDEVKDRLKEPASRLSVGQQQRLCLARALASQPEVILMDEPTSALDPRSVQAIEELITQLKERHTIVLVTHNILQARRVADWLACVCTSNGAGEVLETACCDMLLDNPQCQSVVEYLRHAEK